MKKFVLALSVLCIISSGPVFVHGGDDTPLFSYGFQADHTTYVFADNVRVRTAPLIKDGNITDTLSPGHELFILKVDETSLEMNGITENWLYVKYKIGGMEKKGYVWGGLVAIAWVKSGKDLVLTGLRSFKEGKGLESECRLVRDGKILSSIPVRLHNLSDGSPFMYRYSVKMTLHDSKGLEGLKNIVSIYCLYEACGYPRGNVWIGIADSKLYYIESDTSVSEAGVFHVEERLVFPSDDKSLKNSVKRVTESYEFDESTSDYKLSEKKEIIYMWSGFKLHEK